MTIHILTDSSHYLDPAEIAALSLHVLPLTLHLDTCITGGRMKGSQALVGTLLGIKPVSWLNEGRIELWNRARGKKKALDAMLDETVRAMPAGEPDRALIFDTATTDDVQALRKGLGEHLKVERFYRDQIGPVVAAHVGPGCIAMAVCPVSATC